MHEHYQDFDQENSDAPVSIHEMLVMFLSLVPGNSLIVDGADVNNATLPSRIDLPIIILKSTISS